MTEDLDEDSEMTAVEVNSGGRVHYEIGTKVRFIQMDGRISPIHLVDQQRSDRKGHISLKEKDGTSIVRVHYRRLIPMDVDGKSVVVESQDRSWALCPDDGAVVEVSTEDQAMVCPKCSKTFLLHWMGVKPMADTKTDTKHKADKHKAEATGEPKAEKKERSAPKPKPEKKERPAREVKEPIQVDTAALAKLKHCELWTKKNVKFDHERINVQAHTLLFVGETPRKLCFNTYDGALGKKAGELPIAAFIANEAAKGAKTPWFPVEDLEKTRARLQKDGYEHTK